MIPSSFGVSPSRSSIQAYSLNPSRSSVSSTHTAVRFGSMNLHELGDKGLYLPPAALMDWLNKQNRTRVRTDDDLSEMTNRDWFHKSPAGQQYLAAIRDDRAKVLATIGIGHERTDLVNYFSKNERHIDDAGLIRKIAHELAQQNPGITYEKLVHNVARFMYYTADRSFGTPGIRLGEEGDPLVQPTQTVAKGLTPAQEAKAAWNRKLNARKQKRVKDKIKQPKQTIMGHAARLRPVVSDRTISRRRGVGVRDLPATRPDALLREVNQKYPPSWLYRSGFKGIRKSSFNLYDSEITSVEPIIAEMRAPQEENKAAIEVQKPVTLPSGTSVKAVSDTTISERLALQEIANNSNPRCSLAKPIRTTSSQQSTLKCAGSDSNALETKAMPSPGTPSPFHDSLEAIPSYSSRKKPDIKIFSDFKVSKDRIDKSKRGRTLQNRPSLRHSVSATLLEQPSPKPPALPGNKTFHGDPRFQTN